MSGETLSDKRKRLKEEWHWQTNVQEALKEVETQDREFIKKLKEALDIIETLDGGITDTLVDGKEDNALREYTQKVIEYLIKIILEEIDKLAGEELTK